MKRTANALLRVANALLRVVSAMIATGNRVLRAGIVPRPSANATLRPVNGKQRCKIDVLYQVPVLSVDSVVAAR